MRMTQTIMIAAIMLMSASAWAGNMEADNLTVATNAVICGKLEFFNGLAATGGTITTNGGYCIHTFTNNGTFTVFGGSVTCDVLVVGGGGGGGAAPGGGGGAGGYRYFEGLILSGNNTVVVGAGGAGAYEVGAGASGGTSSLGTNVSSGGGGGARAWVNSNIDGGSGGGAAGPFEYTPSYVPGEGNVPPTSPSQGNDGGKGYSDLANYTTGGGGGGGSGVGGDSITNGGTGGSGCTNSISGSATVYAGGGGGGIDSASGGSIGIGGSGVGGNGGKNGTAAATAGAANTGSGGGGAGTGGHPYVDGAAGGSGIVIVRYAMPASSNVSLLSISSSGVSQESALGTNVFMGKVGIGTDNPSEMLHVTGNVKVDGTVSVSAMTLGLETRTNWPSGGETGGLMASSNLSDVVDKAAARAHLGLGSAVTNNAGDFLTPTGNCSQLTGMTATQVGAAGALIAANNLSDVLNAAAARTNLGALGTAGGVVNGNIDINGAMSVDGPISVFAPGGDIPMGVYTNQ